MNSKYFPLQDLNDHSRVNVSNVPQSMAQLTRLERGKEYFFKSEQEKNAKRLAEMKKELADMNKKNKRKPRNNDYDDYNLPGDIAIGKKHLLAQRISQELSPEELMEKGITQEFCECCGVQVHRKQITMTDNTELLGFLGSGYPLYFDFIKFSFGVLFMIFFSSSIYNITSNWMGTNCLTIDQINAKYPAEIQKSSFVKVVQQLGMCQSSLITRLSYANKLNNSNFLMLQALMNFSTVIVVIVALQFFRKQQRETNTLCDELNTTASDYGAVIKNIPSDRDGVDYDDEIIAVFEKMGYTVSSVSLAYRLDAFNKLKAKANQAVAAKQKALAAQENNKPIPYDKKKYGKLDDNQAMARIDEELEHCKAEVKKMEQEFESGVSNQFSGVAYITFATEGQRDEVLQKYSLDSTSEKLRNYYNILKREDQIEILGKKVVIEMACEPTDVYWDHQGIKTSTKIFSRIGSMVLDTVVTIVLFAGIIFLLGLQNDARHGNGTPQEVTKNVKLLGYLISFTTVTVNYLLVTSSKISTTNEKWSTMTKHNVKLATKLTTIQFINTGVLQFLITYLFIHNYYGAGGLIYNQTLVFATNTFVPAITLVLGIGYQVKRLQRWMLTRKNKHNLTQQQIQDLYENPDFPIAVYYATLLKTIFFCAFYAPIIPVGVVFCMVTVLVLYWMTKYTLLYRSTVKNQQSAILSLEMTELIEHVLIIYTAANFVFEYVVAKNLNYVALSACFIGVLNAILPMEEINKAIFPERPDQDESLNYYEAEVQLETDYGRANPATENICKQRFIEKYQK